MVPRSAIRWSKNDVYGNLVSPKKEGDVGHDLPIVIRRSDMTLIEKLYADIRYRLTGEYDAVKIVWPFSSTTLRNGVMIELPNTLWAKIEGRSSTTRKRLMVLGGIIDSGYRGEYFTVLGNFSLIPRVVRDGERYAQVVFYHAVRPNMAFSPFLNSHTERGDTGFGSTGA